MDQLKYFFERKVFQAMKIKLTRKNMQNKEKNFLLIQIYIFRNHTVN